jgi:membrane-associated protein
MKRIETPLSVGVCASDVVRTAAGSGSNERVRAGNLTVLFDEFTKLVAESSEWAYAIVFVFAFLDALIPIVPSETAVITAGVVAAAGDLSLAMIIPAAAAGAFLGDNSAYFIGRRFGSRATERFFSSERAKQRIEWADQQLRERGGELIAVGRFIPGGRTAVALSAGTLRFPWRRFVVFDAVAALGWAVYSALLGYYGGRTFEGGWGLLLALVTAFAVAGGIELTRWALRRRRERR